MTVFSRQAGGTTARLNALAAGAVLAVAAGVTYRIVRSRQRHQASASGGTANQSTAGRKLRVRLMYGSVTGTSEGQARRIADEIREENSLGTCSSVTVENLDTSSFDELLSATPSEKQMLLILLSTTTDGMPPPRCAHWLTLLEDHVHDFRVSKKALSHLHFAVAGFGSSEYRSAGHFCTAASRVDKGLKSLGAHRIAEMVRVCDQKDASTQLRPWIEAVHAAVQSYISNAEPCSLKTETLQRDVNENDAEEGSDGSDSEASTAASTPPAESPDMEEVATEGCGATNIKENPEMVTKRQRAQLTKEGYKIIGSHSAVKLCRWTKHMLRGRGGCYKHSFYGIASYQCMEATPSLACANKCVFCWRHHKNPTGTSWKWKTDAPEEIVVEGIRLHQQMIRECRGIPGAKPERLQEAMTVRHCALSLVGEPIMYPRINELLSDLHARRISTFLVTNAQFPEAIRSLVPVTQLYVSVDAANKEALKAVDRPLFQDFWERYLDALRELRKKQQRTTYRLTLVKDHNMSDAAGYAKLVALGEPDFIEIKSVTFCGESKASSLTISNTPWHQEVCDFAKAMLDCEGLSDQYAMACEHQHSNIVLLAHKKFHIDGRWHTWINYDKFHDLVASGLSFSASDYLEETPHWAVYGAVEAGFDPAETRVYHNRTKRRAQAGELSEIQLRQYPSDPAKA